MPKQRNKESMTKLMWSIVENMDWINRCDQPRGYEIIKIEFMRTYNHEMAVKFDAFITERFNELYTVVDKYTNEHGSVGGYGGDDSFSDMLYHVIGWGKEKFDEVIADPTELNGMRFVESFAYAVPNVTGQMNDYEELEPDFHYNRAIEAVTALADTVKMQNVGHDKAKVIGELFGRFMNIIAGDYKEAFMDIDHDTDYNRFTDIHSEYHAMFANYLFDAKKNLENL